jgi:hypothetical protein
MSNSLSRATRTGAGAGPAPTRQQLDELDALLQRMLDLPVNQVDEAEALEPAPPVLPPRPARERPVVPPAPVESAMPAPSRRPRSEPEAPVNYPLPNTGQGANVPSYRVPPAQTPAPRGLAPRLVQEQPEADDYGFEEPVPGGRHDLEEDTPIDPTEELARLRAQLEPSMLGLPAERPAEEDPEQEQGEWVPLRSSWQPSAQTWKPLADRWGQTQAPQEPAPRPSPPPIPPTRSGPSGPVVTTQTSAEPNLPIPATPPSPPPEPAKASEATTAAQEFRPPYPRVLLPLVWFNAAFDLTLMPWGPPGRWLRGRSGRALLGTVGLLCLLGAAALAIADSAGWNW